MRTSRLLLTPLLSALIASSAWADTGTDPLKALQWGLANTGQTVNEALTDIEFEKVKGLAGVDVNRSKTATDYISRMSRDVIVAVVDSGVDIAHPDLQGRLFVNTADCDSLGRPPFRPDEDKDKNSYAGDCMGWNVSGNGDENRVNDDVGHGTHVAGIIAATENNKLGIAGTAPRVKILPIKLTYRGDQGQGYTSRMLKALQYALDMKADVINLSLGWPAAADTQALQAKVQEAISRGVIIVVAAGNNTTDKPIYPCSYEGVICVGSIRPDGKISAFSNYGTHVDLLAPGSNILSLIPAQMSPAQFSLSGYDFKSGTSQATPFVSAAFAVLKSIYPASSADELKARLLLSARTRPANEASIAGLIQIDKSIALAAQSAVFPVIKGDAMIRVGTDNTIDFSLAIKNYWTPSTDVQAEIVSPAGITLEKSSFAIGTMSNGQRQEIKIRGKLASTSQEHVLKFILKVSENGKVNSYPFSKTVVRSVEPMESSLPHLDIDLSTLPQAESIPQLHLLTVKNNFKVVDEPEFYFSSRADGKQSLVLLHKSGDKLRPTTLELSNTENVLNFIKMDLNADGRADYMLQTYDSAEAEKPVFRLRYLNSELKSLYDFPFMSYDVTTAMPNWRSLAWVATNYKNKRMLVPLFIYKGSVALVDRDNDPFDDSTDDTVKDRVYFYLPNTSTKKLEIRSFDSYKKMQSLNEKAGVNYPERLNFKLVYPQTLSELNQGEARLLVEAVGGENGTRYYQLRIGDNAKLKSLQRIEGTFNLQGFAIVRQPGFDASSENLFLSRTQSANVIEFAWLRGLKKPQFFSYTHAQKGDNIIGPLTAAVEGSAVRLLVETKIHVVSIYRDSSGRQNLVTNPINRSSLLGNNVFSELFAPVKIKGHAGLYIDASQLYRGHVYALSSSPESYRASIDNSLQIDNSCSTLNPTVQGDDSQFMIYCEDSETHQRSLYRMPMN